MAVQLKGQTTWDAQAKASREAEIQKLYDETMLRPDDTVRFKKPGTKTYIEGRPIAINTDGSINVWIGRVRSIRQEYIEVKMRGPRGGMVWVPLVPEAGA